MNAFTYLFSVVILLIGLYQDKPKTVNQATAQADTLVAKDNLLQTIQAQKEGNNKEIERLTNEINRLTLVNRELVGWQNAYFSVRGDSVWVSKRIFQSSDTLRETVSGR